MTLAQFRDATDTYPGSTELLVLDLCGLLSPMVIQDPAALDSGDPVILSLTPNSLILTSDPV